MKSNDVRMQINRDLIKSRQKKRNDIDDINEFMKVMANICPAYYGDN